MKSEAIFRDNLAAENLSALWEQFAALVPPQPHVEATPAVWRYAQVRPLLADAAERICAEKAERRVLVLENPGLRRSARAADTLYAGLQIIQPGEIAHAHRHTQSALRFVLEGDGAYTTVDGERTTMTRGDFVITPAWTWHEHGNESPRPMVWLDGLDVPIVASMTGGFFERSPTATSAPSANSAGRVINRPYRDVRPALAALAKRDAPDACSGHIVRYLDPHTRDWALPTLAAHLQLLPAGFESKPLRTTASRIFVAIEGRGTSRVGTTEIAWDVNDVVVMPAWAAVQHRAATEAVLFEFSDRATQEKLGLYREQRPEMER